MKLRQAQSKFATSFWFSSTKVRRDVVMLLWTSFYRSGQPEANKLEVTQTPSQFGICVCDVVRGLDGCSDEEGFAIYGGT